MTAPASPDIRAHVGMSTVRVLWRVVDEATDYNLYVEDDGGVAGIEAQFDENDATDGWFHYTFRPDGSRLAIYVTALNVLAEESDPSNTKDIVLT